MMDYDVRSRIYLRIRLEYSLQVQSCILGVVSSAGQFLFFLLLQCVSRYNEITFAHTEKKKCNERKIVR